MQIDKNAVVTLHYKLQEENESGALVEETFGKEPLTFLYGAGNMIPEFEKQLKGKKPGDDFAFGIKSGDAYGEVNEQAVVPLPKSTFIVDGKLAEDLLVVGKTIPMRDNEGNQLYGTVKEIKDEEVILDFNHPMAGVDLYFTGKIEEVRQATPEEIDHGHVHGEGGHNH